MFIKIFDKYSVLQKSRSESLDGNILFIYNMVGTENIILKLQIASCSVIYSLNQNLYKKKHPCSHAVHYSTPRMLCIQTKV